MALLMLHVFHKVGQKHATRHVYIDQGETLRAEKCHRPARPRSSSQSGDRKFMIGDVCADGAGSEGGGGGGVLKA